MLEKVALSLQERRRHPPQLSALLRKWPALQRADFILTKVPNSLYEGHFSGVEKLTRSSLKGFFNRALFAYIKWRFASSFLVLGIGLL